MNEIKKCEKCEGILTRRILNYSDGALISQPLILCICEECGQVLAQLQEE